MDSTVRLNKHVIFVLGMHRSGTSAITRGLTTLGVNLGTNLRTPRTENPKGFWEDLDFNAINAEILEMFDLNWQKPGIISADDLRSNRLDAVRDRARTLLQSRMSESCIVGLKDPRASRVLPFWQEVIQEIQAEPRYIIASRNPLSIAKSLTARDGFSSVKGVLLWLEYMLESLLNSRDSECVVVEYDAMLESPSTELRRMSQVIGVEFNEYSDAYQDYAHKFLSKSLRSTTFSAQDLFDRDDIPALAKDTYRLTLDLSKSTDRIKKKSVQDEICILHREYTKNFNFIREYIFLTEELNLIKNTNLNHHKKMDRITSSISRLFRSAILLLKSIDSQQDLKILFKEIKFKVKGNK
jgi:hypothetical protein